MTHNTDSTIDHARERLADAQRIVGFSGAGISTESGIPDFRSPGGIWARNRTVMFPDFVADEDERVEYWRQKASMWPEMRDAAPNAGHRAFKQLADAGRLAGMITQNIDGLHQKAGLDDVLELHGTTVEVACLDCKERSSMDQACERVAAGDRAPRCHSCGGLLKPDTISFGQNLDPQVLQRASRLSATCDVFIAVGSSLLVQPAASLPALARQNGAGLIIVNRTETPLDGLADIVAREEIGLFMQQVVSDAS
tara:strand:- start:1106 stop:1864 length:759 start_codon:yes stop_codon:yes gene_type:complete